MPCLCFVDQAEQAVLFYTSIFKDSKIKAVTRCGKDEPGGRKGSIRTLSFQLLGEDFLAVNGGPHFKFSDGVSLVVNCDTQKEINYYWERLSRGGRKIMCGWLSDKFGVSWQVTPTILGELMTDPDPEKVQRTMDAVLNMKKLNIEALRRVRAGKGSPTPRRKR